MRGHQRNVTIEDEELEDMQSAVEKSRTKGVKQRKKEAMNRHQDFLKDLNNNDNKLSN